MHLLQQKSRSASYVAFVQLEELGYPLLVAAEALRHSENNVQRAVEQLSAPDSHDTLEEAALARQAAADAAAREKRQKRRRDEDTSIGPQDVRAQFAHVTFKSGQRYMFPDYHRCCFIPCAHMRCNMLLVVQATCWQ